MYSHFYKEASLTIKESQQHIVRLGVWEVPTTITIVIVTMTIVTAAVDIILEISIEIFRIITPLMVMSVRDSRMTRIITRLVC